MTKVRSLLVASLLLPLLAACSKEEVTDAESGVPEPVPSGVNTYASFTFNVDAANTRAGMTGEVGDESTVKDITLLIFDGETTDGELLNRETATTSQSMTIATTSGTRRMFVIANSEANAQMKAELAALKVRADGVTATKLSEFYQLMTDPSGGTTPNPDTDMGEGFKNLMLNSALVMSNTADASSLKTLQPGVTKEDAAGAGKEEKKNQFSFVVRRAVSKGNLLVKIAESKITTADGAFELKSDNITFGVRNVNRSVNYVQQFGNDKLPAVDAEDTPQLGTSKPWAAYYNVFDKTTDANMKLLATYHPYYFHGYSICKLINTSLDEPIAAGVGLGGAAGVTSKNVYFTENSNNRQVLGNTSYFGIATQVKEIAANKIAKAFSFDAETGLLSTTAAADNYDNSLGDKDFWYIREIPLAANIKFTEGSERRVFVDETVAWSAIYTVLLRAEMITTTEFANADALKTEYEQNGDTNLPNVVGGLDRYFGHYEKGVSYYRLNIYETVDAMKRHVVRRNHQYNAVVTSFATIGEPTEEGLDKDPDKPVDAEITFVTATITVQKWHVVDMEGGI